MTPRIHAPGVCGAEAKYSRFGWCCNWRIPGYNHCRYHLTASERKRYGNTPERDSAEAT